MSKPKSSHEIRQAFLEYFEKRGHAVIDSSSLVPAGDPTLLFTNAGMNQFKDLFLGLEERPYTQAVTAQKCMRVSGKHNDLENVGPSPHHHTFFEMLGNFSFGDYFKREAINYAWEFLTDVLTLSKERLWVTIYTDDEEAYEYWTTHVKPDRILRFGKSENFWEMGDTGPCGPCSEIHYYSGPLEDQTAAGVNCDDDYIELWNLVFMQYDRDASGTLTPLPSPSIDTGMGLERISRVIQGVDSNYETDLFTPLFKRVQTLLGHTDVDVKEHEVGYRVLADHIRAATFLVGDGVLPGNEGRNYVLRLILRRAMRFGKQIGFTDSFVAAVAETVIDEYGHHYTELEDRREFILRALTQEEERFQQTLDTGLALLDELLADLEDAGTTEVPGEDAFRLYDTYGFPYDLTRVIAEERGFHVDRAGFDRAMAEQRARARAAASFDADAWRKRYRNVDLPATEFIGYDYDDLTEVPVQILALFDAESGDRIETTGEGDAIELILNRTPFYAEGGGQVADTGVVETDYGRVLVSDVRRAPAELWVHVGTVVEGSIRASEPARASIDVERRWRIMPNHTATHLLHRALRNVLGEHAEQRGSLVAPDRLRFDFAHLDRVTKEELRRIEDEVLNHIMADEVVTWKYMPYSQAIAQGATALFGEKYGDTVRVVSIGEAPEHGNVYTRELCGGTHVERTGQIGPFVLLGESSIGSGVRRIEALTGHGAAEFIRKRLDDWQALADKLGAPPEQVPARVLSLEAQLHEKEKVITELRRKIGLAQVEELLQQVSPVDTSSGVPIVATEVDAASTDHLREMVDLIRDRLGSGVIVLGAVIDEKPQIVAAVTPDLVEEHGLDAGTLAREVGKQVGGGGGGRPTLGQAGGTDVTRLPEALDRIKELIR